MEQHIDCLRSIASKILDSDQSSVHSALVYAALLEIAEALEILTVELHDASPGWNGA